MIGQKKDDSFFASLEPDTVIVVYDEKTGVVRHLHQELTLPGGTAPTRETLTVRANVFARELPGRASKKLKAMYIEPTECSQLRGAFAVDLKTGVLISAKPPAIRYVAATIPRRSRRLVPRSHSRKSAAAN